MPNTVTLIDRLRIERVVWTIDFLVSDLPTRSQRAVRRELRDNLRAAAAEAGASEAVRRLGSLRRLAAGYLDAEYGDDGPRPRWMGGMAWGIAVEVFVLGIAFAGYSAFMDGVLAVNRHASGTYTWTGLGVWGPGGTATFVDGRLRSGSLVFSVVTLVYLAAGFVLGARLWRLRPPWRRA
jgi:hypothetical protein